MKKPLLVLAVLAVALPSLSFAKFTLGGPTAPYLDIFGSTVIGVDYDLEAVENEPALDFYRSLGAVPMTQWILTRMTGDALDALAGES